MPGKASSSFEDRSTTKIPSEGPPYSYIGDGDLRDETSDGEACGDRVPVREGGNVEVSLIKDEYPLADECERLVPLLSSIVNKWRRREKT
jgi:hypothetical protein